MKKIALVALSLFFLCGAGAAHAEMTAPHKATPQQNRMKACAARYHAEKIAKSDYRKFMSKCLKKHPEKETSSTLKKN